MDESRENLPPELDAIAERMRVERPVADDQTLGRVMTRAQVARHPRRRSLLWRSDARVIRRRSLIAAFTALVVSAGMASAVSAWSLLGPSGFNIPSISQLLNIGQNDPPANIAQYECDSTTFVEVYAELGDTAAINAELEDLFPGIDFEIINTTQILPGLLLVHVCLRL